MLDFPLPITGFIRVTHISCNKWREQTIVNGSVGQGFSLSVRHGVQAFCVNNLPWFTPRSLTSSLTHHAAFHCQGQYWRYAYSMVLGFTIKNCFYPQVSPSAVIHCLEFLLLPAPRGPLPTLPFTSGVMCLQRLLCFSPLSTTGVEHCWASPTSWPCAEARALPRDRGQRLDEWGEGLCPLFGEDFSNCRECIIMSVALSRITVGAALLYPSSEEKSPETNNTVLRRWKWGTWKRKWPAPETLGFGEARRAHPHFSYSLSFPACFEVLGQGKEDVAQFVMPAVSQSHLSPTNVDQPRLAPKSNVCKNYTLFALASLFHSLLITNTWISVWYIKSTQ